MATKYGKNTAVDLPTPDSKEHSARWAVDDHLRAQQAMKDVGKAAIVKEAKARLANINDLLKKMNSSGDKE